MTKRILSVIMVVTLFFAGYSILPKSINPLPVNDAVCASKYGGVYKAKKTFTATYYVTYVKTGLQSKRTKTYYKDNYYTLDDCGYDSTCPMCDLKWYIDNFYRVYY